jgi:hypothetical protein
VYSPGINLVFYHDGYTMAGTELIPNMQKMSDYIAGISGLIQCLPADHAKHLSQYNSEDYMRSHFGKDGAADSVIRDRALAAFGIDDVEKIGHDLEQMRKKGPGASQSELDILQIYTCDKAAISHEVIPVIRPDAGRNQRDKLAKHIALQLQQGVALLREVEKRVYLDTLRFSPHAKRVSEIYKLGVNMLPGQHRSRMPWMSTLIESAEGELTLDKLSQGLEQGGKIAKTNLGLHYVTMRHKQRTVQETLAAAIVLSC